MSLRCGVNIPISLHSLANMRAKTRKKSQNYSSDQSSCQSMYMYLWHSNWLTWVGALEQR